MEQAQPYDSTSKQCQSFGFDTVTVFLLYAGSRHTTRHAQGGTVPIFQGHGPFNAYLLGFVWALLRRR